MTTPAIDWNSVTKVNDVTYQITFKWNTRDVTYVQRYAAAKNQDEATAEMRLTLEKMIALADVYHLGEGKTKEIKLKGKEFTRIGQEGAPNKPEHYDDIERHLNEKLAEVDAKAKYPDDTAKDQRKEVIQKAIATFGHVLDAQTESTLQGTETPVSTPLRTDYEKGSQLIRDQMATGRLTLQQFQAARSNFDPLDLKSIPDAKKLLEEVVKMPLPDFKEKDMENGFVSYLQQCWTQREILKYLEERLQTNNAILKRKMETIDHVLSPFKQEDVYSSIPENLEFTDLEKADEAIVNFFSTLEKAVNPLEEKTSNHLIQLQEAVKQWEKLSQQQQQSIKGNLYLFFKASTRHFFNVHAKGREEQTVRQVFLSFMIETVFADQHSTTRTLGIFLEQRMNEHFFDTLHSTDRGDSGKIEE
ncbi:MAG: hypothetical protein KDK65_01335 [Chlamydiia bacterium]|nr:hypothetical protein [Chlamydiia bacterium]